MTTRDPFVYLVRRCGGDLVPDERLVRAAVANHPARREFDKIDEDARAGYILDESGQPFGMIA